MNVSELLAVGFSAVCAAAGSFAATRVTLRFHELWLKRHDRELDRLNRNIENLRI